MSDRNLTNRYLAALGRKAGTADLYQLKALQAAHLARYSFNNLGVLLGEERPLEIPHLFQTIVEERRGGYCFEHNALFQDVLRGLGYDVRGQLGRVLYNRQVEEPVMPRTHRITVVTMGDARYVVDVGFGVLTPREPVRISHEETRHSDGSRWRIVHNKVGDYLLQEITKDGPFTLYSFDLTRTVDADFELGHFYSHRHPKAAFVNNLVVALVTADERRVIRNRDIEVTRDGQTVITQLDGVEDLRRRLGDDFGYDIAKDAAVMIYEKFCRPRK